MTAFQALSSNFGAKNALDEFEDINGAFLANLMIPDLQAESKIGAIKELIDRLQMQSVIEDGLSFLHGIVNRENLQSTILGDDFALLHACSPAVRQLCMAIGVSRQPIGFRLGEESQSVRLICLLVVPLEATREALGLQGLVVSVLRQREFKQRLLQSTSSLELYRNFLLLSNHLTEG